MTTDTLSDAARRARAILDPTDEVEVPTQAAACCSTSEQDVCCEPEDKGECCGSTASAGGGCGCR